MLDDLLILGGAIVILDQLRRHRGNSGPPLYKLPRKGYRPAMGDPVLPYHMYMASLNDKAALRLERVLGGQPTDAPNTIALKAGPRGFGYPPSPVSFKPGEPTSFAEYDGQAHLMEFLVKEVRSIPPDRWQLSRPQLLIGPPGLGKTALAQVIAVETSRVLEARGNPPSDFILAFGSNLKKREQLDALMRRANNRGSILFIDEIHTLVKDSEFEDLLKDLFDKHRWPFLGDRDATDLEDFTILAGTTDYGALDGAFRRRFAERQLMPLSEYQIALILARRFKITSEAALLAASRTWQGGAPWEGIALVIDAQVFTRDRGSDTVDVADIEGVFRAWDLDAQGLKPLDRAVIKALLTQQKLIGPKNAQQLIYAANEESVVSMARVDREAYKTDIRPRLMSRGLLVTSSRGQQLTDLAVQLYNN